MYIAKNKNILILNCYVEVKRFYRFINASSAVFSNSLIMLLKIDGRETFMDTPGS